MINFHDMDAIEARYPRLLRCMQYVACLASTEAKAALRDYALARDGEYDYDMMIYGGGEAVCHFGGPQKVINRAKEYRTRVIGNLDGRPMRAVEHTTIRYLGKESAA